MVGESDSAATLDVNDLFTVLRLLPRENLASGAFALRDCPASCPSSSMDKFTKLPAGLLAQRSEVMVQGFLDGDPQVGVRGRCLFGVLHRDFEGRKVRSILLVKL